MVKWPEALKTNTQRLLYQSDVKLLRNAVLEVRPSCINETTSSRSFCYNYSDRFKHRCYDLRYELFTSEFRSMTDFDCIWPIFRHYGIVLIKECAHSSCEKFPIIPKLFRLTILNGTIVCNYSPNYHKLIIKQ